MHGEIEENVYMIIPPGVSTSKPNKVCKLFKSLYGIKKAIRRWYERLTTFLIEHHYTQTASGHSLFVKTNNSSITILLVYVDDVILTSNDLNEFHLIKIALNNTFKIKDLGKLKYFLGIEVAHSKEGIMLYQRKYCLDLLEDSGFLDSKPVSTTSDPTLKLHQDSSTPYHNVISYRRLIGRLLYLNATRPHITFCTQQLSQFMSSPTVTHFKATCRILKYLKSCPAQGILLPRDLVLQLHGYSDVDWADCLDTRKSIFGQCFFLGHSHISWRTKKQLTISRSSSQAEYQALAAATCELQWLLYLVKDLHITCTKTPIIYCDNQNAIHIASNPVFYERTKHLEIDCHVVREKQSHWILKLLHVKSKDQLTDLFTKSLHPQPFHALLVKLKLINIYQPLTYGGCWTMQT